MIDREKIIETLKQTSDIWKEEERHGYIVSVDLGKIADALIMAGIGDVSEYKEKLKLHRVFVRKDGGDIKVLYGNNEVDEIVKERNEYKHRAEVAERALYNACCEQNKHWCVQCDSFAECDTSNEMCIEAKKHAEELIKQAEKELAEEGK